MRRVLFIGNSFTYYNEMPAMFSLLANDADFGVGTASVVKGGWYLSRFADPEDEMGKALRAFYPRHRWDDIVLQDQSLNPAVNREGFLQAVRDLRVLMPEGRFVFYQTWAYEYDSAKLAATGLSYEQMRVGLRDAYRQAAEETGGLCVPVGDGFGLYRERFPQFSLYRPDSFHPNLAGSYMAACMFLACLSGKRALTDLPVEHLDARRAETVRDAMRETLEIFSK